MPVPPRFPLRRFARGVLKIDRCLQENHRALAGLAGGERVGTLARQEIAADRGRLLRFDQGLVETPRRRVAEDVGQEVDRAGVLKVLMREDGAGPHTTDSSSKKAYTTASLRRPTSELAELINKMPTLQALREMNDRILILGGGLPIEIGGEVVGGIGVGGAPGTHLDDACAQAGLDSIGAAPKVKAPAGK